MPTSTRRRWPRVLAWTAAGGLLLAGLVVGFGAFTYVRAAKSNLGELSYTNALRIPPLDTGTVGADGVRRFDLDIQAGETQFRAGEPTPTWGVNGTYLGPTLRASRGDEVEISVTNSVDEATTLHWHGMHLPPSMDGGPHQMVEPGDTWTPTWTVDQPAASLWYHPHPHGETAEHVYRGVAGMFILDDPTASALDLPATYGVDDIPLIVQDRSFKDGNDFSMSSNLFSNVGALGDEILVNGTHDPYVDVTHQRVRLRLLNASNARFFEFGFVDGRSFDLIGTDGGLLGAPVSLERLPMSPGERAEIIVEFQPGEEAVLRSFNGQRGGGFFPERFTGQDDTFDIIQFRAASTLTPSASVPAKLVDVPRIDPSSAETNRAWRLSGTQINGRNMDMERIDATATLDTTEIWTVKNSDGQSHNFHVHDVQFQVLDIDGSPPPPRLAGWKDTIAVPPDREVRLIMTFADHADADTPYMFHCHILSHEDDGMMGQFVVLAPGEQAGSVGGSDHDHHG
jgi:FtsP/CotA-like multicopper oxidase with cupredoxin domain